MDTVVLDQGLSPNESDKIDKYFDNAKMIIVDRDPRDMFADDERSSYFKTREELEYYTQYFIKTQLANRERIKEGDRVMVVHFEDLITHYDDTVGKITDFLGIPIARHLAPGKYLDTSVSIHNVGFYKQYIEKYKVAFDMIEKGLDHLLYPGL